MSSDFFIIIICEQHNIHYILDILPVTIFWMGLKIAALAVVK